MLLIDRLLISQTIVGIEVIFAEEDKLFNYSVLKKHKDSFEVLMTENNLSGLSQLSSLPKGVPICVAMNGKNIIHKKLDLLFNADDKSVLSKVLPTANLNDFYFQKIATADDNILVSVIRRSIVDDSLAILIQTLPHNEIISLSLGPFCASDLIKTLDSSEITDELIIGSHDMHFSNSRLNNYTLVKTSQVEKKYTINEKEFFEQNVISAGAAFQYFYSKDKYLVYNVPLINAGKDQLKQKNNFKIIAASVLSFFFTILLINYFSFNHYWNKKNDLSALFSLNQDKYLRGEKLKKDFSERLSLLAERGLLSPSRLSFYADQLAATVPESILLSRLNLNPLNSKVKEKDKITFNSNKIIISGTCGKSIELNEWIKRLKTKSWVNDIVLINYGLDESEKTADFTIEISIK